MKIAAIYTFVLLSYIDVFADKPSDLFEEHALTLKNYNIEKNFQGFSYSSNLTNGKKRLNMKFFVIGGDQKVLSGIWIDTDNEGVIKEVAPIFNRKAEQFNVITWALDNYDAKKIKFDTLWSIMYAAQSGEVDDKSLMLFLLETISFSENGFKTLDTTLLEKGDESLVVIQKMLTDTGSGISLASVMKRLQNSK